MIRRASTWSPPGAQSISTWSPPSGKEKLLLVPSLPPQQEDNSSGIGNSRDAQPTSPTLAGTNSEPTTFKEDIHIFDGSEYRPAVALIDTLCEADICISQRLVERLGKADEVSNDDYSSKKRLADANGGEVESCGSLTLQWKIFNGHTVHENKFLVLRPRTFDVIIGKERIVAANLISYNRDALKPMIAHKKVTLAEKAKIALQIEEQRQEKAALEAQRLNSEKGKQPRIAQSSRG